MSLCLKNRNIDAWEDVGTNRDQDYLTHSIFRYFGKLPPILTCKILTEFVIKKRYQNPLVLDLMCGSGTTLVEAQKLGIKSIGIDSNDISLLISKVKTTKLNLDKLNWLINEYDGEFCSFFSKYDINYKIKLADRYPNANLFIPKVSNIDKWFTKKNQIDLAICRSWIEQWKDDKDIYDFLLLCWLGIIRQCSNASVRTGRIFLDKDKIPPNVYIAYLSKLRKICDIFKKISDSQFALKPDIYLGDARTIKIPSEEKADFTFFHPPYFALYKYSSDVLRFELEWGGYNRKDILRRELRDGFKTSDCDKIYPYIDDLKAAIINGFNNTKENHNVGIVVGNSTLAEKNLPIIENLLNNCENDGICCTQIIRRPINHSQATYHKSANPNIKSNTDFILIFARV